ncbi:MAG: ankyrin repeat domain-containing protein [Gallionella sp.]
MDARLLGILNNREQNYPHALEKQFPRILAQILSLWDSPEIDALFSELMVTKRSDRQGFPSDVASDIIYLSMVHTRQSGRQQNGDPWGNAPEKLKREIEQQGVEYSPQGFIKAAESGKRDIVALFLSSGANVDTYDDRLWTPLMISSFNGDEEMAALLIRSGANIQHKDSAGYAPLHWAAFNGYSKVVKLLLSKHAEVNARSNHGWTPLLQAATRGHLSVSVMLVEAGADVNAASNDGWTSLHKAATNGHLAEVKLLLSKGANFKVKYRDGTTALDLAIKNKHQQIVTILSVGK